ncbi:hypothetical protein [Castellaniella sp. GW247-6E4]|uniref:hypothetical protein n=1 Tax=Castellaniella sp. GW247-6E4 TaxID=3140380 RepID=UPI0033158592
MRLIPIRILGICLAAAGLAACAPTGPARKAEPAVPQCQAAAAGDAMVGNWLSVASQRGVAGALRTLYTLNPDGTMVYVQQIKRPRAPSQGLHESGCWHREGTALVLRTILSNGSPVNLDDPIYTNRYEVQRADATTLRMQGVDGTVDARRMSPGYRLPF